MNRFSLVLASALAALSSPALAENQLPVANQVADYTGYAAGSRSIDLLKAFTDPDGSNAVHMETVLGPIDLILYGQQKPITVANFLRYVDEGRYFLYDKSVNRVAPGVIHRSVYDSNTKKPFVIQGGGYVGIVSPSDKVSWQAVPVQELPSIKNEPGVFSNSTGTIAMAKAENLANSATSQWFINLNDNGGPPTNLDTADGGFTVFGRLVGQSLNVAYAINAVSRFTFSTTYDFFDSLPLRNYTKADYDAFQAGDGSKAPKVDDNLVTISSITQIPPMTFTASSNNPAVADVTINGTFLHVNAKQVGSARISVTATDLDGASVSQAFNVNVVTAPGRLVNISTRLQVGTQQNVLIGGFIVRGDAPKRVMVRGIGPSLAGQGVANPLTDPILELHDSTGAIIASNDNWQTNANKAEISDTGIAPTSPDESAIITTLPANSTGIGYTAVLRGVNDKSGVGLVEVYDLDSGPGSTILNISTRGRVDVGENVMIGGFFVGGTDARKILVRAIGPSLGSAGVTDALKDPALELRDAQGTLTDSNDDWQTSAHQSEIQASGVPPSDPKESATYDVLVPGAYTAIVHGNGDLPTGVGLVEVYQLP
jgi:cyclophilin family peptidyl-prolyl cis-trans isomerase